MNDGVGLDVVYKTGIERGTLVTLLTNLFGITRHVDTSSQFAGEVLGSRAPPSTRHKHNTKLFISVCQSAMPMPN